MTDKELNTKWQLVIDLYDDLVEYIEVVNADVEILSKLVVLMDAVDDYADALEED
jgi:hypothetical protein